MHIGVDATCWHNARGFGRQARGVLTGLAAIDTENRYTFLTDWPTFEPPLPAGIAPRHVAASAPSSEAAGAGGHRTLRDMWRMSRALSDPAYDTLLFPSIYTYVPVRSRARKLIFFHDAIAARYPVLALGTRRARILWRIKERLGLAQADRVITVSEYSRRALAAHFRLPIDQVGVVGEAADPIFRPLEDPRATPTLEPLDLARGRVVVYVGGFGPHKNLPHLLESFAAIAVQPGCADVRLLLVGEHRREVFYSEHARLQAQIDRLVVSDRIRFTGFLPDPDLVILLNLATVLVLPSLMEGLGLPALEAAACGCPVVATRESALPALLGEGGTYIDPHDPHALRDALMQVLESGPRRRRMAAAGLEATGRLTWERAARELLAIIREAG